MTTQPNDNANQPQQEEQPDFHPRLISAVPLDLAAILVDAEEAEKLEEAQPDFHPRLISAVPLDLIDLLGDEA